jgi:hypothetical protein
MDVLRFSGSEILFRPILVDLVIGAQAEAFLAVQELGEEAVGREADRVLSKVAERSCHFLLRREYTARNGPEAKEDPYDPCDTSGDGFDEARFRGEEASDPFLGLRVALARLRHAVGWPGDPAAPWARKGPLAGCGRSGSRWARCWRACCGAWRGPWTRKIRTCAPLIPNHQT